MHLRSRPRSQHLERRDAGAVCPPARPASDSQPTPSAPPWAPRGTRDELSEFMRAVPFPDFTCTHLRATCASPAPAPLRGFISHLRGSEQWIFLIPLCRRAFLGVNLCAGARFSWRQSPTVSARLCPVPVPQWARLQWGGIQKGT